MCACSLSLFPSLLLPGARQQLVLSPLPLSLYYCCHRQSPAPPRLCAVPIQFGVLLARVQHSAVINHYTTSPPRQPTRPLCIAHAAPPPRSFALPLAPSPSTLPPVTPRFRRPPSLPLFLPSSSASFPAPSPRHFPLALAVLPVLPLPCQRLLPHYSRSLPPSHCRAVTV